MGEEADDIVVSFGLTTAEGKQYNTVKAKFESHFVVKNNVIFERAKFNLRSQKDNESVDSFITDLYCLAQYCEFRTLRDDLIRDRIVVGLKDKKVSEKLQLDPNLALEKAVTKARQSETVKKQQTVLQGNKSELQSASVDHVSKGKGKDSHAKERDQKKQPKLKHASEKTAEAKCSRCLGSPHTKRLCPARESKCIKCSKVGHWAKACRSRSDKRVGDVNFSGTEHDEEFFLGGLQLTELGKQKLF